MTGLTQNVCSGKFSNLYNDFNVKNVCDHDFFNQYISESNDSFKSIFEECPFTKT